MFSLFFSKFGYTQVVETSLNISQPSKSKEIISNGEKKTTISELTKDEILAELTLYETESDVEYDFILGKLDKKVNSYIQHKEKECRGEFSSVEFNELGESKIVKRKLSRREKKLCLLKLVSFRKEFTVSIFKIRRKYLLQQHKVQLQNLDEIQSKNIKFLDKLGTKLSK